MARPTNGRKRTWRFRLSEDAILEVSARTPATEKQVRRRGRWSLILGTLIAAVMVVGVAWGDDISNNIDASVDAPLEVLTLSPTGADTGVGFWVKSANSDGDQQCNIDLGESMTIEVTSSNPAVANVVSPANRQLTFADCASSGTDMPNVRTATIDPVGQGTATVSVRVVTPPTGGGSFVTTTASFTVNVDDPPSVTSTTPSNGATDVAVSSTITMNFNESVANDNAFSLDCPASTPVAFNTSASPASSYTLTPLTPLPNGTTCTVSVNKNKIADADTFDEPDKMTDQFSFTFTTAAPVPSDTTPPSVTANVSPAPNAAGWNNSTPVALTWTITDSESAASIVSGCADESFTSETAGETRTCTASSAGGTTGPVSATIKIDTTKPVITGSTGAYVPGTWTNQSVTVSFTCADNAGTANSGIASSNVAGETLTTSAANQSVTNTGTCTDAAGNVADPTTVNDIDIDKVAPTVACNGGSFLLNEPSAQVSATITDTLSGPLNGTEYASADTSSVGEKSVSITGYDNAGNSTAATCSYTVGYRFDGLFAPIDRPNTMNVSKAGQAIPLKWRLTDFFGNGVTNLTSVIVSVTSTACTPGTVTEDLLEEYAAGSSGLQNLGDGYYQFNWKTPTSYAGSCKKLNLKLGDEAARTNLALISFKK